MTESRPLSERINAPDHVAVPPSVDGIVWRPATKVDAPAILECETEMGAVDHTQYRITLEDIEVDFDHSWFDASHDSLIAFDDNGRVVAWGSVTVPPEQESLIRCLQFGGVRPSHRGRGLGNTLMTWQGERGLQLLAESDATVPGVMVVWADQRNPSLVRLAQRHGFDVARHFLQLTRKFDSPIGAVALHEGYEVVSFDSSRSEAVRAARNDSFRDHWGSQPSPRELWDQAMGRSNKRPDLSFLALAPDGEVAAFVMTEVNVGDFETTGFSHAYINLVGTRRAHRGRGLAKALLVHTLEACRADGLGGAVLDVDSESPTGATALYEQVGFVVTDRSVELNKTF